MVQKSSHSPSLKERTSKTSGSNKAVILTTVLRQRWDWPRRTIGRRRIKSVKRRPKSKRNHTRSPAFTTWTLIKLNQNHAPSWITWRTATSSAIMMQILSKRFWSSIRRPTKNWKTLTSSSWGRTPSTRRQDAFLWCARTDPRRIFLLANVFRI